MEKYTVVNLILDALNDLESRGYYPQDLKLPNILLSADKRSLYVIDLGAGLTEGMYRAESERAILQGKMQSKDMLYTFGRTVWDLYDGNYPDELIVPVRGTLPPLIERLITECCGIGLKQELRVVDVREIYRPLLEEAATRG